MKMIIGILSKPQLAFVKFKNKKRQTFGYLLILALIMSIPAFLLAIVNKKEFMINQSGLNEVSKSISEKEISINEGKLVIVSDDTITYLVDDIYIQLGNKNNNMMIGYVIRLEEEGINTYISLGLGSSIQTNSIKYSNLIDEDTILTNNPNLIFKMINTVIVNNNQLFITNIMQYYFGNLIDLVLMVLFLSILAKIFIKLPLKFGNHFNINTYVATSYAFSILLLGLFNLLYLDIIAIIIVYIYQTLAYKSVRIVTNLKVGGKDE